MADCLFFSYAIVFMISGYFLSSIDAGMTLSEKTSKLKKTSCQKVRAAADTVFFYWFFSAVIQRLLRILVPF